MRIRWVEVLDLSWLGGCLHPLRLRDAALSSTDSRPTGVGSEGKTGVQFTQILLLHSLGFAHVLVRAMSAT